MIIYTDDLGNKVDIIDNELFKLPKLNEKKEIIGYTLINKELAKFKFPIKNQKNEIIAYNLVSKEDYEFFKQFNFHLSKLDVSFRVNKVHTTIHKYIMKNILKLEQPTGYLINHINKNNTDNRRENLRYLSKSDISRNKFKLQNTTSKYSGVRYRKETKKWIASFNIDNILFEAIYEKEEHAAYQYNLWCKEFESQTKCNLNIIPEELIKDFIPYKKKEKTENLPPNITKLNNKFRVQLRINNKQEHIGMFDTLNEAIKIRDKKKEEIKLEKSNKIKSQPIKRNNDGIAIIEIYNDQKEKILETLVDDYIYYNLMKCKWKKDNHGYIKNNKMKKLHRYVYKYYNNELSDDLIVDHINNNKLDNRIQNLRAITIQQNNMNTSSRKNSSSKYVGVSKREYKNYTKYRALITLDRKSISLGEFDNEIDAAKARDNAIKLHYQEYGNLNFSDE